MKNTTLILFLTLLINLSLAFQPKPPTKRGVNVTWAETGLPFLSTNSGYLKYPDSTLKVLKTLKETSCPRCHLTMTNIRMVSYSWITDNTEFYKFKCNNCGNDWTYRTTK